MFLTLLEAFTSATLDIWFSVAGVMPSLIFKAEESAVLILNAEDGSSPLLCV